jgi:NADPH:quinone reductase-like Zn-dependent oxidoreductase
MPLSGAQHRVLVLGVSSGVGPLAVQFARAAGATMSGLGNGKHRALVESLGAQ